MLEAWRGVAAPTPSIANWTNRSDVRTSQRLQQCRQGYTDERRRSFCIGGAVPHPANLLATTADLLHKDPATTHHPLIYQSNPGGSSGVPPIATQFRTVSLARERSCCAVLSH